MTTQIEGTSSRPRRTWPIVVGCAALVVCLGLAGIAGAGALWFSRRAAGSDRQPAVEYILDASPRMALPAQGAQASRLIVAQGVLAEIVRPADPGVSAGLRVFGSGALPDACRDTDLLVPLGTANQGEISDRVQALQAGAAADAAMAEAMVAAIRDLADPSGPHTLVVVTGGADSCNPEAGELIAREAERAGIDLQLFVVGYQVSDEDAAAIKGTVEESAGTYLAALTEDDLRAILEAIQAYIDEGTTALLEQVQALATPEALATAVAAGGFTPAPPQPTAQASEAATAERGVPTAAPTAGGTAGYEAQSACDHPYFPLRQGATWTYSSEFGGYTWTVTEVSGDLQNATATMQMTVRDETITYHWNCSAEGVGSFDFGNVAMSSADGSVQMDIVSSEGAWLLPADEMEAGASWTHTYSLRMTSSDGLVVTSEASQSFTAAGLETTETEAGSFETLRVDGTAVYTTSMAGLTAASIDSTMTHWLAYGIGIVRSDSVTSGSASSAVLVSYSIP